MYGQYRTDRTLAKMDDRMMELSRLDSAIKFGRLQAELRESQLRNFYMGIGPDPGKYERTPEYRLMRHLEREFVRIQKAAYR